MDWCFADPLGHTCTISAKHTYCRPLLLWPAVALIQHCIRKAFAAEQLHYVEVFSGSMQIHIDSDVTVLLVVG